MSWSSHLPPRYCCQQKDPPLSANQSSIEHHSISSQSSMLEEHQLWLDEFSGLGETSPEKTLLRRSASDSVAILQDLSVLHSPTFFSTEGTFQTIPETQESQEEDEMTNLFGADYVFGPNSPRQKSKLSESQSSVVSAILENAYSGSLQSLSTDLCSSVDTDLSGKNYFQVPPAELSYEKPPRRPSGQRSRARKLQYIAELQRTVNVLETIQTELVTRVNSLSEKRLDLTIENSRLKWKITSVQKEKIFLNGQYHSLKNEVDSLKTTSSHHQRTRSVSGLHSASMNDSSGISWQMLDMGKLNLGW